MSYDEKVLLQNKIESQNNIIKDLAGDNRKLQNIIMVMETSDFSDSFKLYMINKIIRED